MTWVSIFAVYFILWWVVLFTTLPFGLRTQDEDGDVTLGTTSSAPGGPHMLKVVIRTTIISAVIFGAGWAAADFYGFSFDDIPRIGPRY